MLVDGDKGDIAHVVINNNELKVVDVICQSCYKSVEVKKFNVHYYVYYNSGRERSKYRLETWLQIIQDLGCGEVFIKSIDFDGTMRGLDYELLNFCVPKIDKPLIYSGGCSSDKEIIEFKKTYKNIALSFASHFYKNNFKLIKKIKKFK